MAVDDAARRALRLRLAADRDMFFEIAPGQVRHHRPARVLRRERQRHRLFPGLHPRDDEGGPLACLIGAEHGVAPDRDPPSLVRIFRPVRSARLGDEDLAAGRIPVAYADHGTSSRMFPNRRCALPLATRSRPKRMTETSRDFFRSQSPPQPQPRANQGLDDLICALPPAGNRARDTPSLRFRLTPPSASSRPLRIISPRRPHCQCIAAPFGLVPLRP